MVGVHLAVKAGPILEALADDGVLAMKAGPKELRFLPPLVINRPDLATVSRAVDRVQNKSN